MPFVEKSNWQVNEKFLPADMNNIEVGVQGICTDGTSYYNDSAGYKSAAITANSNANQAKLGAESANLYPLPGQYRTSNSGEEVYGGYSSLRMVAIPQSSGSWGVGGLNPVSSSNEVRVMSYYTRIILDVSVMFNTASKTGQYLLVLRRKRSNVTSYFGEYIWTDSGTATRRNVHIEAPIQYYDLIAPVITILSPVNTLIYPNAYMYYSFLAL
jgi:hypothetical protein